MELRSNNEILSTTTSTQDSGLLDVLIPVFEKQTGYPVKTISVGTGQALALAAKGDADVALVHAPSLEKQYVAEGKLLNELRPAEAVLRNQRFEPVVLHLRPGDSPSPH